MEGSTHIIQKLLADIQKSLFDRAKAHREANMHRVDDFARFKEIIDQRLLDLLLRIGMVHEKRLKPSKRRTRRLIRCIPLDGDKEEGVYVYSRQAFRSDA